MRVIDLTDEHLSKWVLEVLDHIDEPSFGPPTSEDRGTGVSLYLMGLAEAPAARGPRRTPHRLALRYLVTTFSDDALEAHRMLSALVFDAMDRPEFEVEFADVDWSSFNSSPRPGFVIKVLLNKERPEPVIPKVLHPLVLATTSSDALDGIVLGPEDVPLVGAAVDIPRLQLHTETDVKGCFRFASVPKDPPIESLVVRVKGRSQTVHPDPESDDPIIVRFEPVEV